MYMLVGNCYLLIFLDSYSLYGIFDNQDYVVFHIFFTLCSAESFKHFFIYSFDILDNFL